MYACNDSQGWPLGENFFVRVTATSGQVWRGWITAYDEEKDILTVRDSKKCFERYVRPENATFVKPTTMDKARKLGQDKTLVYMSDKLKRRKLRKEN